MSAGCRGEGVVQLTTIIPMYVWWVSILYSFDKVVLYCRNMSCLPDAEAKDLYN